MNIAEIRQKYPQYNDLADEELAQRLHARYYSDLPYEDFAQRIGVSIKASANPATSNPWSEAARRAGRQLDLGLRNSAQGLANTVGIFTDPWQQLVGMPTVSGATSRLLTSAGLPNEETNAEKLAGAGTRAITGGGAMAKAASAIPAVLKMGPEAINNLMAARPLAQMTQAGIGGGASELARQAGGNEWMQLLAGALTPMAASGAAGVMQAAGRGVKEAVRPVTQAGAKQIAADVLGKITQDKTSALRNLDEYNAARAAGAGDIVPGVERTAGAASKDYGIIGGQRIAERGAASPDFSLRHAENNAAMVKELQRLNADKASLAKLADAREKFTAPMREAAFDNATGPVNLQPVARKILDAAETAEGGGADQSRKALSWLAERVGTVFDEGRLDPRNVYELEKDIGKLVAGKVESKDGRLRLAGGVANAIRKELVDQISAVAPGFDKYLSTYARFSKRLNRLEVLKKQLGDAELAKVSNAGQVASASGIQDVLSQAKMRTATRNIGEQVPVKNGLPLAPHQQGVLNRVGNELDAQTLAASGGKPPGSDTFQNMAGSNLFGSILGEQMASAGLPKFVSGPVNFLYNRTLEPRIREMVTQAYLDPKKMAELIRLARTSRRTPTLHDLATNAEQNLYGGLLGNALQ